MSYRKLSVKGGAHAPSLVIKDGRGQIVEDYIGLNIQFGSEYKQATRPQS
jgi:hypothetical protein